MSAASIKKRAADRRAAGKGPKNTSYTTADGEGVSIKNGVKTYSDKPVNVKGRSGQSISGRDYSINKGGTGYAITTDQLGTTSPVIPEPPRPDNVGDLLGMNNASVLQEGLTLQGGQFVPDPTASDQMNATREANMNMGNVANSILGYLKPEENQMADLFQDTYGISDREAGRDLRDAERAKNQYTAQLNTLTANRDAEMLKLEGQGRGQTSGFIGGEQARINREAAIQALPIQAQLAAAQADYETAKSHVDTLFGLKVKDLEAQQAYKTTVANTFMSVATAQQQNLLNAAIADSNAKAEAKKIAMNDAKSIAMQAIEYGQSSLARSVMSLDPTSPTYQEDVLKMMGQLSKPVAATAAKAPDLQNFGTADNPQWRQYNYATGTWDEVDGISGTSGIPGAPDTVQKSIDQLSFLRNTAKDALANAQNTSFLRTPVGPSLISRLAGDTFIGNTSFRQLQNQTDTLKTNVLSLMTDPNVKKFFGPQMSNADVRLMSSTGSTLDPQTQSPQEYIAEVKRLDDLFNRMETAVKNGLEVNQSPYMGTVITAPDGSLIEIID